MGIELAYGMETGATYTIDDIIAPKRYAAMKLEALVDENGTPLTPVQRQKGHHYRRLGGEIKLSELPRYPRSKGHNALVADLHQKLLSSKGKLEFYTYAFDDEYRKKNREAIAAIKKLGREKDLNFVREYKKKHAPIPEQPLFVCPEGNQYDWFLEHEGRLRFDDETFIQPDLSGRGHGSLAPTGRCPAIIIEVIRTHVPEKETLRKLVRLSRMAYQVYFYFIKEEPQTSRYNNITEPRPGSDGRLRIRVAFYFQGGELVANGEIVSLSKSSASPAAGANVHNEDDALWVQAAINHMEKIRKEHDG